MILLDINISFQIALRNIELESFFTLLSSRDWHVYVQKYIIQVEFILRSVHFT